jgi:hypothetical protein
VAIFLRSFIIRITAADAILSTQFLLVSFSIHPSCEKRFVKDEEKEK